MITETPPDVRLPSPFQLTALDRIDSTNEEAKRQALDGGAEGMVIWARSQTGGRGRRGRSWVSDPGNLYTSVLLRPGGAAAEALQLGYVSSLAAAEAVAAILPGGTLVECKWPNDVLVEGRKIAGLLMESASDGRGGLDWLVIGIGINVSHHPEDAMFPATDLAAEGASGVAVDALLRSYYERLSAGMCAWRRVGFAAVRRAWLARAWRLSQRITVRLDGETLEGHFHALAEDGALVLRQADGTERHITAGDVFPVAGA